ncbi:MAG: hypothetical protein HS104_09745 [Polyangiaceae bacterium]|nr:hypothetical protein [Polyangiaceae bacterium]MCE7894391.1 hypothetical protein [Sorangiineae bacterium PRO1]MCL4754367.1 hypothetical protein [Myxococcales bacterium]
MQAQRTTPPQIFAQKLEALAVGLAVRSKFFGDDHGQGFETGDMRRLECEIGEALRLTPVADMRATWALLRVPPGSTQTRPQELRPDVPGVYVIGCTLPGGWTRTLELCAFEPADLYAQLPRKTPSDRYAARVWLNEPGRETAAVIERLEKKTT